MEKTQWTKSQMKVIELRDRNILVSAAAGSGKTAVLVERIIARITKGSHPADIDRLLVVTFTNAAAAEMRDRIGKALEEQLALKPDNIHLQKQMTLLHSAQITTIHSFCLHVIRNYFHLIGLEPGFRMADEAELVLLRSDVAEELLEKKYKEADEKFLTFIESYSTGKTDAAIEELMIKLYEFSISYPWPKEWLLAQKKCFRLDSEKDMENTPWMKGLLTYIRDVLTDIPDKLDRAEQLCREPDGPAAYLDAVLEDKNLIHSLLSLHSYAEYAKAFLSLSWTALKRITKKDNVKEELKEQVKLIRKDVKGIVDGIRKKFFFQDIRLMADDLKNVSPVMDALVDLVMEFSCGFAARKREKRIVDFNDLEHFALDILVARDSDLKAVPTEAARELSEYYEEILIDEYQDSNLVQETILTSISRERIHMPNLFMVGDVKQSIYKFRLARPELFMDKYNRYDKWEDKESINQRIDLHQNFRSRSIVLESINEIFYKLMTSQLGGIQYDDDAALHAGMRYPPAKEGEVSAITECTFICEEDLADEMSGKREMEGKYIAMRIKELTAPGTGLMVFDKERKDYRLAKYSDIVILLRTMSGWADEFMELLNEEGIPAYTDTRSGYFSAIEVRTVLNLLKIIDNPRQDIPLAAVLLSPIGDFTPEDLAYIRVRLRQGELYEALLWYQQYGEEEEISSKVNIFLTRINQYRTKVPFMDIHSLIQYVAEDTGYYHYVSVMPAGEKRKANLDMLIKKAVDFEATSYRGLFHFNRYIEKLYKYEVDFGEAYAGGECENAVGIMSIHKSKGLEFPIVFAAGFGKTFNQQDAKSRLVLHPDLGLGPDFINLDLRTKNPTLIKRVIQKQLQLENLGEELRVLYVALTRAKEKLIITGTIKSKEEAQVKWNKTGFHNGGAGSMEFHALSSAGCFLDWIGPVLLQSESKLFQVRYLGLEELIKYEVVNQAERNVTKEELLNWDKNKIYDKENRSAVEELLIYRYPFKEEEELPSKMTVTELKKRMSPITDLSHEDGIYLYDEPAGETRNESTLQEILIPRFMEQRVEAAGARRGSVYHKVMEHLDLKAVQAPGGIGLELKKMVDEGRMKEEDLRLVDKRKLELFAASPLCSRMEEAQKKHKLYREQKFVIGVEAAELFPCVKGQEYILIQGIIDAYLEEEDGLVLIDYKTDRVQGKEGKKQLTVRYKAQFDYYQKALEQLTHKKVKERYLYSFSLNQCLVI